jgi:hypothetical protein
MLMTPDHGYRQWRPSSSRPPEPTSNKIISIDKDAAAGASHAQPTGMFQGSNPALTNDANAMAAPLVPDIQQCQPRPLSDPMTAPSTSLSWQGRRHMSCSYAACRRVPCDACRQRCEGHAADTVQPTDKFPVMPATSM